MYALFFCRRKHHLLKFYEKYWRTALDIALIVLTVYLLMLVFSYTFSIAKPIYFALIIYAIIKPLANFLERRKIKRIIAVTISTFLLIIVVVGIFVILGAVITSQIQHILAMVPKYSDNIKDIVDKTVTFTQDKYNSLPDETITTIKENAGSYTEKASVILSSFLVGLFQFLTSIPKLLVNFGIGIILAFFLALEVDSWNKLFKEKTPRTFKHAFSFLKDNVIKGLVSYIKSQLILILFTFVLVFIGFLIFAVKSSFLLALFAALLDLLPLLGISTFFIPWIVYLFIVGNSVLAIKLCVLLGIVLLFRQIMEPKITGDSLGVSAFTMLSAMILSLSLFGVAGVILSPVILILMKALIDQGYLKQWIRIPEDEFDTAESSSLKETKSAQPQK